MSALGNVFATENANKLSDNYLPRSYQESLQDQRSTLQQVALTVS